MAVIATMHTREQASQAPKRAVYASLMIYIELQVPQATLVQHHHPLIHTCWHMHFNPGTHDTQANEKRVRHWILLHCAEQLRWQLPSGQCR